jgi:hypothetical protein
VEELTPVLLSSDGAAKLPVVTLKMDSVPMKTTGLTKFFGASDGAFRMT